MGCCRSFQKDQINVLDYEDDDDCDDDDDQVTAAMEKTWTAIWETSLWEKKYPDIRNSESSCRFKFTLHSAGIG